MSARRWVAELALSPNGLHEIREGAVNARERPLVGYAANYDLACEIAALHNDRVGDGVGMADYRRGFRDGYERRHIEVLGALT